MKQKGWLFLFIPLCLLFSIPLHGAEAENVSKKQPYRVPVVDAKIKVDGILEETAWQKALVLTLDYEVEPGENITPPVKTEVLLACDTKHLYVAFRAFDPNPSRLRAHFTDRDTIANDDYVGIVLDTFNDSRFSYGFCCNPYGIQFDYIASMGFQGNEWDGIWDSAGKIYEQGYQVEMAIPFSSLRFQHKKVDQVWGIDAVRSYPRNLRHLIGLFPRDRSNICYMCQAEKVTGFKNAKPGLNLEFDPTLSALLTQEREDFPQGKFVKRRSKLEPGLTARWSFTPNLTLTTALNPDFSHVEADAAQLDINTQFILFYPEKRPFFLEGLNIFSSRFYAVYTRSIVDPNWGIKLTGKEGRHAIGFFSVQDNVTNLVFPGSETSRTTSLDMHNIGTVLRYRYDVGRSSVLGLILTDREGEGYFNRVASIDGYVEFTRKDRIIFQYLCTQTRYPEHVAQQFNQPQGRFIGNAFDFLYRHDTEHFLIYAHYQNADPEFRTDLGFVDQTGIIIYDCGAGYTWRHNPGHWYTMIQIGSGYFHMLKSDKNLLQKVFSSWLTYSGPLQSLIDLRVTTGKRTYLGQEFDGRTLNVTARLRPSGSLLLGVSGAFGDQVDFLNAQAGKRASINPIIQFKMGAHLYLAFDHVFETLHVNAGRLYTANLSNLRLVYQFNRRTFLRTILQFANFNYNTQLYTLPMDPEFSHLFSQVLFSYKINPQTVLFLGYSDDYYGYSAVPLTQNNRTFFLKIGYALVL